MSKWNRYQVTAEVDLDYELDDDDILAMAEERGLLSGSRRRSSDDVGGELWDNMERDARAAFARRDAAHFEIVLLRMRAHADVPEPPGAPALFDDDAPRSKPAHRH